MRGARALPIALVKPNQMVMAELVGSSLKFSYCELERAIRLRLPFGIALLKEQYTLDDFNC